MHAFLADLVVGLHLLVVVFMLSAVPLVLIGWPLGWSWIRNPWIRFGHLGVMAYIVINALRDELCFLTNWEIDLRILAGQRDRYYVNDESISFVGRLLRRGLYVELPQDQLHLIYLVFGALVLLMTICVRPRSPFRRLAPALPGAGDDPAAAPENGQDSSGEAQRGKPGGDR